MNYKEKLESYLNQKNNKEKFNLSFGIKNEDSIISKNENTNAIEFSFNKKLSNEIAESIGVKTNDYKKLLEECLNTNVNSNTNTSLVLLF
jgi:hypothetical protein